MCTVAGQLKLVHVDIVHDLQSTDFFDKTAKLDKIPGLMILISKLACT